MNTLRILIVDDDPDLCRVACWALEPIATCCVAHGLDSAIRRLEETTFDIALVDVTLHNESGLDLLDDLVRQWPDTAATIISGSDDLDIAQSALARGAIAYLVKPFRVNDLRIHVSAVHSAHRRMRAPATLRNTDRGSGLVNDRDAHTTPSLVDDLDAALERGEIRVVYQPQFLSGTKALVGIEALARWRHPSRGDIPPSTFVALAERHGLIARLGENVLHAACRDSAAISSAPHHGPPVSVNVSVAQLRDPNFCDVVLRVLRDTGLPPARLCLEVTESLILDDSPILRDTIRRLTRRRIRFSLDDFGTGFATFETLAQFPWSELKVDRSLTARSGSRRGREILQTIVAMATGLGIDTVAEGIETERQLRTLQSIGFGTLQGYLLGRPQPIEQLRDEIDAWDVRSTPLRVPALATR
jgi:EAL domain-containing protein (putative c-di-GMP-specific phosphodiesterase class I)/ActR/RegA family two-component response regulator